VTRDGASGFFEIGVFHTKSAENIGTLLRSAWQLGAAGVFTIGRRYSRQSSDTTNAPKRIPVRHFDTFDDYIAALPLGCPIVAVEMGGRELDGFTHPPCASYLLGAEDHGISPSVLRCCHAHVSLPSVRTPSFNVAVAGSLVMFHRVMST
jgi:tRNA G18 (ribose-2'-O)-methylase SpoU